MKIRAQFAFGSTTISKNIFPTRLTLIDEISRPDHHYLTTDHDCYFLGEYTARRGFSFSKTNSIILNFKKSMDRQSQREWRYKQAAIAQVAKAFRDALEDTFLEKSTLIPMPPSKAKSDPLYDDRILKMLQQIPTDSSLDIRDLLMQDRTLESSHDADHRPSPEELALHYSVQESECQTPIEQIGLFDDVITTGSHFVAASQVLSARFPGIKVYGLFVARRIPETTDFSEFFNNAN